MASQSRVVLSGALSAFPDMVEIRRLLEKMDIPALLPDALDPTRPMSPGRRRFYRTHALFSHVDRIRSRSTLSLLVVNPDRNGIPNFVSPTTFSEIAIAFAQRKGLFLLYGVPSAYEIELSGWNVAPLYGDLSRFAKLFKAAAQAETHQLSFLP
jgi:hypothetical protein